MFWEQGDLCYRFRVVEYEIRSVTLNAFRKSSEAFGYSYSTEPTLNALVLEYETDRGKK